MGYSIALLCAQKGFEVMNIDISNCQLIKAKKKISNILDKLFEKNKLSAVEVENIKNRIGYSTNLQEIRDSQIVIEAVSEDKAVKTDIIKKLEDISSENTIVLSNTSGISITRISEGMDRPQNIMGAHFFNPPTVLKIVELVKGKMTSRETYETTKRFMEDLDRDIVDAPESYGFIVNRLLIPMINEAAFLLMEGTDASDIDLAMRSGANHPMGPLELGDFIGLDIVLSIIKGLYSAYPDRMSLPCPLLEGLVSQGKLGKKSGQGFYKYNEKGQKI